jgi:hypothetical protein
MIHLTGFLGQLTTFLILLVVYSSICLGLFLLSQYILWEILIRKTMIYLKAYRCFLEFIYYRKNILKWIEKNKEDSTPDKV